CSIGSTTTCAAACASRTCRWRCRLRPERAITFRSLADTLVSAAAACARLRGPASRAPCNSYVVNPNSVSDSTIVSTNGRATFHLSSSGTSVAFSHDMTPTTPKRLRLVVFQEEPGLWLVRGLEHDLGAEARTIGEAIRAAMQFVQAHSAFDLRHHRLP